MGAKREPQKIKDLIPPAMGKITKQQAKKSTRGKLYFKFPFWLIDSGNWAKLSGSAAKLLLVLGAHANIHTRTGVINRDRYMKESGIKDSHTFANALKELEGNPCWVKTWWQHRKQPLKLYKVLP